MVAVSPQAIANQRRYQKEWMKRNPDKVRAAQARYDASHAGLKAQLAREHRRANPAAVKLAKTRYCDTPRGRFNNLKGGAKKRGLMFEISLDVYTNIVSLPCDYCGSSETKRGIDRVDNNVGYLEFNCAPCCMRCNIMKREMSLPDFLSHIQQIAAHQRNYEK